MDAAAPNSNHFASRAVDIAIGQDAARMLTLAFSFAISLDIATKSASAARITAPSLAAIGD